MSSFRPAFNLGRSVLSRQAHRSMKVRKVACHLIPVTTQFPVGRFFSSTDGKSASESSSSTGGKVASESSSSTDAKVASESSSSTDEKVAPESSMGTNAQSMEFKAETRRLLDIVTNSLYTDKEVFLRELVSNASDALEKLRHVQTIGKDVTIDPDLKLEILITADEEKGTLTITDTGIGMTSEELVSNLGTIARSGSKAFMNQITKQAKEGDADGASSGIIGQFGVGFYSAFMVGEKVEVRTRSAYDSNKGEGPKLWTSTGTGSYEVADLQGDEQERGSSIVIHLKPDFKDFSDKDRVEGILKKYSNFVSFPILLNEELVNTMDAVWAQDPREVKKEKYTAFYRFIANAIDSPLDTIHFRADAPIDVKALFYIPSFHSEKYGMDRMEPGVSLYSRKVLIASKSPDILPDWMRFIKGVVDSEDLPLSISREKAQDTKLITKLRKVLTRKFISHLTKMAKKEPIKYIDEFYKEFGFFLKEGICQDYEFQDPISKLLYFETSKGMRGEMISLDDYISRCKPDQKDIYYLHTPTRDMSLQSPYMEAFEKTDREVILVFSAIDDFVMANLGKYEGRKLVSAEKADIDLPDEEDEKEKDKEDSPEGLSEEEATKFCSWFQVTLTDKVSSCKTTTRLGSSPAIVTDSESGAMRRMMRLVDTTDGGRSGMALPKQQVELNPKHPIIIGINSIKEREPTLAKVLIEQIFDNCLLAAGVMDDGRSMLPRLNDILLTVVKEAKGSESVASDKVSNLQEDKKEAKESESVASDKVSDLQGETGQEKEEEKEDERGDTESGKKS